MISPILYLGLKEIFRHGGMNETIFVIHFRFERFMIKNNQYICEIDEYGDKFWLLNGQYHREDGPAVEYVNGYKAWYLYDQLHRLDGPAVEHADGNKSWYYYGKYIDCASQEEFERLIKLKALW